MACEIVGSYEPGGNSADGPPPAGEELLDHAIGDLMSRNMVIARPDEVVDGLQPVRRGRADLTPCWAASAGRTVLSYVSVHAAIGCRCLAGFTHAMLSIGRKQRMVYTESRSLPSVATGQTGRRSGYQAH